VDLARWRKVFIFCSTGGSGEVWNGARMIRTRGYHELIVWQRAVEMVPAIYQLTEHFPASERFGLTSQVQRAAVSVAANIAEGQAREAPKPFANHLGIARGSLAELDTLLIVATRLGYLKECHLAKVTPQLIEVRKMLQGLIRKLNADGTPVSRRPTPVSPPN
jgi:four helix bundle protein